MRVLAAAAFSFCLLAQALAQAPATSEGVKPMLTSQDIRAIAPALEGYAQGVVLGDLWKRPGLSPRGS